MFSISSIYEEARDLKRQKQKIKKRKIGQKDKIKKNKRERITDEK